jgi:hypothetical protein
MIQIKHRLPEALPFNDDSVHVAILGSAITPALFGEVGRIMAPRARVILIREMAGLQAEIPQGQKMNVIEDNAEIEKLSWHLYRKEVYIDVEQYGYLTTDQAIENMIEDSPADANVVCVYNGASRLDRFFANSLRYIVAYETGPSQRQEYSLSGEAIVSLIQGLPRTLRVGWSRFDQANLLRPTLFSLILGHPGHGKSTFAYMLLRKLAQRNPEFRFMLVSYDMNKALAAARMLSTMMFEETGEAMPYEEFERRVREGRFTKGMKKAWRRWDEFKDRILLLDLDDNPTIEELSRIVKNERMLGAVFIDHHEIIPTERKQGKLETMEHISWTLKQLANVSRIHICLLCQANVATRKIRDQDGNLYWQKPSSVRHSNKFVADSRVILGVWNRTRARIRKTTHEAPPSEAELLVEVRKNTMGQAGFEIPFTMNMVAGYVEETDQVVGTFAEVEEEKRKAG